MRPHEVITYVLPESRSGQRALGLKAAEDGNRVYSKRGVLVLMNNYIRYRALIVYSWSWREWVGRERGEWISSVKFYVS